MVLVERLNTMLRRLIACDLVLDNSSDSPELLSGSIMAEMLLSPDNRHMSGLLFRAWEAGTPLMTPSPAGVWS